MPIHPPPSPSAAEAELRRQVEAWANEGGGGSRAGGMLRVLVMEDDAIIGVLLARIIAGMGHVVIGLEATEQGAVATAAKARPDLILVDERLRTGSGHAAMEHILRHGFIRHIWMSGNPVHRTSPEPGVAALRKPFTERDLELAIAQVVEHGTADGMSVPAPPSKL